MLSSIDRVAASEPTLDVRRLTGRAELRVRVGDWHVRFTRDVEAKLIVVQRLAAGATVLDGRLARATSVA